MLRFLRKVRVALTPREWLLRTRLSNGAIVYGRNRPGFGGRGIYVFGDALEPELLHLGDFLDTTGVFVDVGANTGVYTLKAARHFGGASGVVLALEPFPDLLATLSFSVRANGFTNVRLRNICAADATAAAVLWRNFDKPNSFGLVRRDAKADGLSVLAVALDDLFAWERLDRLDYLKVDAEGAEAQVLAGAANLLRKHRPIIQVEVAIKGALPTLADYAAFQAPGSPNRICMPREHPRASLPERLGWTRLA